MKNGVTFTLTIILASLILFSLLNLPLAKAAPAPEEFVLNDELKECKTFWAGDERVMYTRPADWKPFEEAPFSHKLDEYLLYTDNEYRKLLCSVLGYEYSGYSHLYSGGYSEALVLINNKTDQCKIFFIHDIYSSEGSKEYNNLHDEGWEWLTHEEQTKINSYRMGSYILNRACSKIDYNFTGQLKVNASWVYKPDIIRDMKNILDVSDLILFVILSIVLVFSIYAIFKFRKNLKSRIKSLPFIIPLKSLKIKKKSTGKWPLFTYLSPWALGFNIISIIFFIISVVIGSILFTGLSYESKIASLRFIGNTTNLLIVFSPLAISILISILGIFKKNVKTTMTTRFLTLLIGPEKIVKKLNNLILTFAGIFFILLGVYLLFSMFAVSYLY